MSEVFRVIRKAKSTGYEQVLELCEDESQVQHHIDEYEDSEKYIIVTEKFVVR